MDPNTEFLTMRPLRIKMLEDAGGVQQPVIRASAMETVNERAKAVEQRWNMVDCFDAASFSTMRFCIFFFYHPPFRKKLEKTVGVFYDL